jgi:ribosome-associated protein
MQSHMPLEEKIQLLSERLREHKANNLTVVPVHTSWADALIIVCAASARHAQSLADDLLVWCGECKQEFLHMEGYQAGQWILVDLNDVIVHNFQPPVRELYRLEALHAPKVSAPQEISS